ncbi:TPA: hypothetical protein JJI70_18350 [Cronobacter sakazakii]|nr:hypothetical protein [Cronobacter sakazakii]HAV6914114.1 hypothetical protein [Cronobacter sakazakii]
MPSKRYVPPKRYLFLIPHNRTVYKGNFRIMAWLIWRVYQYRNADAYDCGVWVKEPASWLKCREPSA